MQAGSQVHKAVNKENNMSKVQELVTKIEQLFNDIELAANEGKEDVTIDTPTGNITYSYVDESRPSVQDYWDDGVDEDEHTEQFPDWDYTYSGWQTSSTFC